MVNDPDWHVAIAGWIGLLAPVALAAVGWVWWSFAKVFVKQEECEKCRAARDITRKEEAAKVLALETAQQQMMGKLVGLETSVKGLPRAEDISALTNTITALQGSINTMGKHIDGSVATLDAKVDALNTNMGILLETHLTVRSGNGRP